MSVNLLVGPVTPAGYVRSEIPYVPIDSYWEPKVLGNATRQYGATPRTTPAAVESSGRGVPTGAAR